MHAIKKNSFDTFDTWEVTRLRALVFVKGGKVAAALGEKERKGRSLCWAEPKEEEGEGSGAAKSAAWQREGKKRDFETGSRIPPKREKLLGTSLSAAIPCEFLQFLQI